MSDVRARLLPLEPLRRRVVRVYWMRGLLALLVLATAAGLGLMASVASAVWAVHASSDREGELVVRIVPVLLAFLVPLVAIAGGAGVALVAILKRFGRETVHEHDRRFRDEVVAPLLKDAVPGVRLDVKGDAGEAALRASRWLVPGQADAAAASSFVMRGAGFTVAALELRRRGRLGRGRRLFRGLVADIESAALLAPAQESLVRELERQAGVPARLRRQEGVLALALPLPRAALRPPWIGPSDPELLARAAACYALVARAAGAPPPG